MKLGEFVKDAAQKSGQFADWKSKGKIIFFIHPRSEIGKRVRVMFRLPTETDDGLEIKSFYRYFTGKNDITTKFLAWLRDEEKIADKEVVLRVRANDEMEEYKKGDLLGLQDKDSKGRPLYDWRKRLLSPRTDYLFCIVPKDGANGTQILNIPKSAGQKMSRLFQSQAEEYGAKGDPYENPWPIKLAYHEKATPMERYSVERHLSDPTEEHFRVFENEEPDDILAICDETQDLEEEMQSADLLKAMLVIPCPLFDDLKEEGVKERIKPKEKVVEPPPKPKVPDRNVKAKAGKAKKKKGPKTTQTKPKRVKQSKKVKETEMRPEPEPESQPEPEEEMFQCANCHRAVPASAEKCPWAGCGAEYDEDDDEYTVDGDKEDINDDDDVPF